MGLLLVTLHVCIQLPGLQFSDNNMAYPRFHRLISARLFLGNLLQWFSNSQSTISGHKFAPTEQCASGSDISYLSCDDLKYNQSQIFSKWKFSGSVVRCLVGFWKPCNLMMSLLYATPLIPQYMAIPFEACRWWAWIISLVHVLPTDIPFLPPNLLMDLVHISLTLGKSEGYKYSLDHNVNWLFYSLLAKLWQIQSNNYVELIHHQPCSVSSHKNAIKFDLGHSDCYKSGRRIWESMKESFPYTQGNKSVMFLMTNPHNVHSRCWLIH